jgi:hypothetical protein
MRSHQSREGESIARWYESMRWIRTPSKQLSSLVPAARDLITIR